MIKRYLRRIPHALRGIRYALAHDFGFRTQIYTAFFISAIIFYLFFPLSVTELLFLAVAAMLILITELQNSALEIALDHLHPEHDTAVKHSKDMAAGAVLLAAAFATLVLIVLLINRL